MVVFVALRVTASEDFGLGLVIGPRGLAGLDSTLVGFRTCVGSAVPGRMISFFVGRIGRTGAEFNEPNLLIDVFGREVVAFDVVEVVPVILVLMLDGWIVESSTVSMIETEEGGRSVAAAAACFARFCASMVSFNDGLERAFVGWRAKVGFLSSPAVSETSSLSFAGLGLAECFQSSSWCLVSIALMILRNH